VAFWRLVFGAACTLWWAVAAGGEPPRAPWYPQAPPLPPPGGEVIRVENVTQLFAAAEQVSPGGTIMLADGFYAMPRYFELHTDNVTLRSATGQRDSVILDGTHSQHGELVGVSRCTGVTIADLTIQNIKWNGFKINSNLHATRVTIRNCVIHNIWQRGVKGPAMDEQDRGHVWPTDCCIEYCLFYNDRPKAYADDPADTPDNFGGNYIGGIDAMHARGWVIRDNVLSGIHGRTGEGRGAIFLWNESHDCVVERNIIIDCDCGICLGNPSRRPDTPWHARRCLVRNNFVTRCGETGVLAAHTRDCRVIHNTIHDPASQLRRLIWVQDDNDGLLVANNLLSGPDVLRTGTGPVVLQHNVAQTDLAASFVDAAAGNLRLRASVPGDCACLADAPQDIDGCPRPAQPAAGAHQYPAAQPPAADSAPAWVDAMRAVHTRHSGAGGYVAQLGDSIMIGTNDISGNRVPEDYASQVELVVRKCLDAGCIPILNTIPPRRGHAEAVAQANDQIRAIAQRCQVPLVDYHAEILARRPEATWDGTLISEDGVHPTAGETQDYSAENLGRSGYALRNWLNFLMVRELHFHVLHPQGRP